MRRLHTRVSMWSCTVAWPRGQRGPKSSPGSTTELVYLDAGLRISLNKEVPFSTLPKDALAEIGIIDAGVEIMNDLFLHVCLSLSLSCFSFSSFSLIFGSFH